MKLKGKKVLSTESDHITEFKRHPLPTHAPSKTKVKTVILTVVLRSSDCTNKHYLPLAFIITWM